jgi:hypothetical protein
MIVMINILGTVEKAIYDYNMIEEGDKIAVGLSGGKDSLTLLTAMAKIQKFFEKPFDLIAIHVNMGFKNRNEEEYKKMADYVHSLGVEFLEEDTRLAELLFEIRKEKNPCSLCANIRRGALNSSVQHQLNGPAVVGNMQPVADLVARLVNRHFGPCQKIGDGQRNEFFGKMIRAEIIGAISDGNRQPVSGVIGPHQVVRGGLAGRIRAAGVIRALFRPFFA